MANKVAGEQVGRVKMDKPNIIALPTSQMMAFCDLLGISRDKQESMESMIPLLEGLDFSKLEVVFQVDQVGKKIVGSRKVRLGRV